MNFGYRFFKFLDKLAHIAPSGFLRMFSMPLDFQVKAGDGYLYESAGMVYKAFGFITNNKLKGDYAEFGVFRGRGLIEAYYASKKFNRTDVNFWAFDSFEGLPEIAGEDIGGPFEKGEFYCGYEDFERNLRSYDVDMSRVKTVKGFYNESLSPEKFSEPEFKIAIAWVDCDLYESTVPVLDFLTERLIDGAVVIFDDWYCFNGSGEKGEQRACAEWLEKNPNIRLNEYHNYHWAGKSFIFNRLK